MQLPAAPGTTCTLLVDGRYCGAVAVVYDTDVAGGHAKASAGDFGFRCCQHQRPQQEVA